MSLSKSLFLSLLLLAAAILLTTARPAAAAKLDAPWAGSGPGTAKVVADGATASPRFDYLTASSGNWTFSAVAGSARTVPVKWDYTGFHSWFQVRVSLERFVSRGGVDVLKESLVNAGPVNCCSAPSGGFTYGGTSTFNLQKGDVYGFRMAGSNFDSDPTVRGSLALTELDTTPPTVTPVVTGAKGANGYYTGPVSVKWNVADDDSLINTKSGCDDATVTEDTTGKTFTCKATSRGGNATGSVTIKRDSAAPELTVPATIIQQATGAARATVNYETSATDKLDAAPQIACDPASGSTFAVGNTTVSCTATDAAGNATTKTFDAVVFSVATPAAAPSSPYAAPAPRPAAPKKINAVLAFRFTISKNTTRLVQLKVKNIPAGSTVKVNCKGSSCPKKLKGKGLTTVSKGSSVSLATLLKTGLKGGTTINVTVSNPGAITSVKTLVVRKGKAPVIGK
jgi:HYR domain-containing protein